MRARVSRWGNSLAIRLPKAAVASLQVREGEPVELVIEGDTLMIRAKRPHYTLEELVAAMRSEDEPEILDDVDYDPKRMLEILERTQDAYGYLPVAALKRISQKTGAWYAFIYGTATFYGHLRFEPAADAEQAAAVDRNRPPEASYVAALGASLAGVPRGAPPAA